MWSGLPQHATTTLYLLINPPSAKLLPPPQKTCHSVITRTPNIYPRPEEDMCACIHTQERTHAPDTAAKCVPSLPTVSMATTISLLEWAEWERKTGSCFAGSDAPMLYKDNA